MDSFSRIKEELASRPAVAAPPSTEEQDALRADLEYWVPDLPSLFRRKTVLDLGAGTGRLGLLIATHFEPAAVVSVDIVLHRLRAAVAPARAVPSLKIVCGDVFALPFPDASFDCVIANSVLHHLPGVTQATKEIGRILRPCGYYIGGEPNFNNPAVRWSVFGLGRKWFCRGIPTPNEYPLRAREIVHSFAAAGCRCDLVYFWRRFPRFRHPILSAAISVRAQRLPAGATRSHPA